MPDAGASLASASRQALQDEIVRLNKIVQALMDRAESSASGQGTDFSLFQTAVMLEEQVRSRTEELLLRQERLEMVLQASNTGLWQWDPVSHTIEISATMYSMLGYAPGEFAADEQTLQERVHADDWSTICQVLQAAIQAPDPMPFSCEFRMRDNMGDWRWLQGQGRVTERDRSGQARRVVGINSDISERKRHAEHLEAIAHHDALTGLPNRLLLCDRLRQAIAHNQRAGTRLAVCYLDLDGFKQINDRYGHSAGDQLLIDVANRLSACVRGGDTVARLGGDEFVVLLSNLISENECRLALDRLLLTLAAPYRIGDSEQGNISASIGVTLYPNDRVAPDTLMRHADHAMYVAKQAGKNRYQIFDTHLEQRIEVRHMTLRSLADALGSGQFCLHYQPKIDCRHGRIIGAEALIRWQHPTLGLLSPAEFIPLIEDADLAIPVGTWVIRAALAQIVQWRRQGIQFRISVNVFIRQLLQPGFVTSLAGMLAEYPEAGSGCLQIELVETAALQELDSIRQVIEDCGKLDVTFSLDDFGTGYSTLAHLRHLPACEIKIDLTYVRYMLERAEDLSIVEAVIGLGRAFGRTVVAEGVETQAQIDRLLTLGCDVMQGYALARPMPAAEFTRWVREFVPSAT